MDKQIIGVQLRSNKDFTFSKRIYSYFTDLDVKVGDMVLCPTIRGDAVGRVAQTHVPDSKVDEDLLSRLASITEYMTEDNEYV